MPYILISAVNFFITLLVHVLTVRKLSDTGRILKYSFLIFLSGFLVTAYFELSERSSPRVPLSGISLFALTSVLYLIFFSSPLLGDQGPSAKIYFFLKRKRKAKINEIIGLFNNDTLIYKRLREMVKRKLIFKKRDKFYLTDKGRIISDFVLFYRKLMRWEKSE